MTGRALTVPQLDVCRSGHGAGVAEYRAGAVVTLRPGRSRLST